ncbi:MAG: xanthine dehydrogenase family protein molybdopterin-binding subunit [Actinomycetia bacterium]|nr:xanthine dehydrogenase family protein molybdopterin-binding subunit [Actinomycetes bacterium]
MATAEETVTYVGQGVARKEDAALVTGGAKYIDDLSVPGMLWMAVVRSPLAHARVVSIDLDRAREAEGVVAAFSGDDLAQEWAGGLPCAWPVTEDTKVPDHYPLTTDKARHVGDGIAVVIAETRALAKDAAELVDVELEALPAVTDVEAAAGDGAPILHESFGTNESYTWVLEAGEVGRLFAEADVTVSERYRQQRLIPSAIEPRGVMAAPSPTGDFTVWSATQVPHVLRTALTLVTGIPEARLRIVAPEVGGGFGSKLDIYAEEALCLALARRLGRPVKWVAERSEGYLATIHGRDVVQEIELAATSEGRITAVRTRLLAAMGAYLQLVTPGIPILGAWLYGGCYDIQGYSFTCTGVFTNTTPIDAYRGAGRPEATYAIEHAVDALARRLDKDPVEIRRLNFIKEFPATIASGLEIDSGDFEGALDRGLELLDYDQARREQEERRAASDSKQLGIGFSTYVEMCGLAPSRILGAVRYVAGGWEATTIRCLPTGTVQAIIGTSPHGQGHVTTFSQIVADQLGVPIESVEVIHGDTVVAPLGMDTYGSRSLAVGGVALWNATEKIIAKAQAIVAHQLEVAAEDLEYANGTFTVRGTDRSMTVTDAAFGAWTAHNLPDGMEPGLEETAVYDPPNFSWPGGCHIAVVEVDTDTGDTRLVRYIAVDDVGNVINPTIVDGQVHGGIAQGAAQALFEEAVYDDDGNLANGSMTGYLLPSAAELPSFELDRVVAPSPTNPLGVKGVGETGTIASTAAVMNAVVDALAPLGVSDIDMPASPERVWAAIEEVRA